LVDESKKWFEFRVDHEFSNSEEIDCDLEVDSNKYDYEFSKDSDNYIFARNYNSEIELDCDDDLDSILFIVYNDDEQEEFRDTYTFDDRVTFNDEDLELTYEFRLEFNHDFRDDDEITCDIVIDSDINEEVTFDEDSRSSETRYIDDFKQTLEVDCNEDVNEMVLDIYLESGVKLTTNIYAEEDNFEYDLDEGEFNFFIIISDTFYNDEEVKCELFLDTRSEDRFTLDSSSSITDKRQVGEFNEQLELICESELSNVELIIYEDDEAKENLFEKTYSNQKEISYFVEEPVVEVVVPVVVEETTPEPVVIIEEPVVEEKEEKVPEIELETIDINAQVDQNTQNTLDSDITDTLGDKEPIQKTTSESDIPENSDEFSSTSGWFVVFLIVFLIIVLIGLGYRNVPSMTSNTPKKGNSVKKKDIDFSFLNKKK
jgi:hypothetical protein